ncbi:hypothetical protein ORV05_28380 [Amycolatopsis cynarae]|uniref:Uncharacterized protein n=1 Tax=Amycolatopsis cynarae TaxID=2995223 RepID=A0ABY7B038_9PSEU|nr:hypothetical protein [Amycolatopsis sp. HUAS 11-8]WAL64824.1 hypothetical protein ORV05_28380 [Amycolatopsis sp. HUAS 11-8]
MIAHRIHWRTLVIVALVGIAIVISVWWAGPGALGSPAGVDGTPTEATVTKAAPCNDTNVKETVQFRFGGQDHTGSLDACGHDQNDRVEIMVPTGLGSGTVDVHLADVVPGHSNLRRPLGLALLALSCLGGATYAFLVQRGPRRQPVPA